MKNTFFAVFILCAPAALQAMDVQVAVAQPRADAIQQILATVASIRAVGNPQGTDPLLIKALARLETDKKAQEQAVKLLSFLRDTFQTPVVANKVTGKEGRQYDSFIRQWAKEYNVDTIDAIRAIAELTFFNEGFDENFMNWYEAEKGRSQGSEFFDRVGPIIEGPFQSLRVAVGLWNPTTATKPEGFLAQVLRNSARLNELSRSYAKAENDFANAQEGN